MQRLVAGGTEDDAGNVVLEMVSEDPVTEAVLPVKVVSGLTQRLDTLVQDLCETLAAVVDLKTLRGPAPRALEAR